MSDFLNRYPYSDAHELNLDWVISEVKKIRDEMGSFKAANEISYDGSWDIAEQYAAWTVVLDENTGFMYVSLKPVPVGIEISNSEYWILVSPFKIDTSLSSESLNPVANKVIKNKVDIIDSNINTNTAAISELNIKTTANTANISSNTNAINAETLNRTNADNVINSRIDEIISGASVDPDAELLDIRIGANGITYPTAGDAVRGQYSENHNMLTNMVDIHENILDTQSYYDGYYWKRTTPIARTSAADYRAFYAIPFEADKTYYYKHIFLYYTVVVYEGTSTVVTLTESTAQDVSGKFEPSQNGVIYVTAKKVFTPLFTEDEDLYNSYDVNTYYTPKNLRIDTSTEFDNLNVVPYTDGYYINASGLPASNASYRLTEYIPIDSETIYSLRYINQTFLGFYDDTKTFISRSVISNNDIVECKFKTPEDAKYIRLSYLIAQADNIYFSKKMFNSAFHVGANYPYTKLTDAINDAVKSPNEIIYLHSGTYDIYDEIGASFFETYTSDDPDIILKNNLAIIGSSDSLITFNYTGSNDLVKQYFSVFGAGVSGFTLQNVNIEASNCRYIIHDERYTANDQYTNKYLNCHFILDNSENEVGYSQCIGGGLGTNGEIVVKDCYLKSVNDNVVEVLSYHNSSSSSAKSKIIASGNYCDNGTMRFSWYGTSTDKTPIIVSNNSLAAALVIRAENESAVTENIEVYAWNNEIR